MKADLYTKIVLTIIAGALAFLVLGAAGPADRYQLVGVPGAAWRLNMDTGQVSVITDSAATASKLRVFPVAEAE